MELDADHFRDCVRDVLAMAEAFIAVHAAGSPGEAGPHRESLRVLHENADADGCLKVSVSMVATSFQMVSQARARSLGTGEDAELAAIFAEFRRQLT
jgi:hypothetical protein